MHLDVYMNWITECIYLYSVSEGCTDSSLVLLGEGTVQCDFTVTNLISKLVTAMLRIDRGAQGLPSPNLLV